MSATLKVLKTRAGGTVKSWNDQQGVGKIAFDNEEVDVCYTTVRFQREPSQAEIGEIVPDPRRRMWRGESWKEFVGLETGEHVTFDIAADAKGRAQAINVTVCDEGNPKRYFKDGTFRETWAGRRLSGEIHGLLDGLLEQELSAGFSALELWLIVSRCF